MPYLSPWSRRPSWEGERASYVRISGNGSNALDFHIAYYIGKLAAADPGAYFHIVSKDTGFDPLIRHLKAEKILAGRVRSIEEIPIVRSAGTRTTADRVQVALEKVRQLKAARLRNVKTLSSTLAALFLKQLPDEEIGAVIGQLAAQGHIVVDGTRVTYRRCSTSSSRCSRRP